MLHCFACLCIAKDKRRMGCNVLALPVMGVHWLAAVGCLLVCTTKGSKGGELPSILAAAGHCWLLTYYIPLFNCGELHLFNCYMVVWAGVVGQYYAMLYFR